jgi:hypothetical protein
MFAFSFIARPFATLTLLSLIFHSGLSFAQFNSSRAISRAIDVNTSNAMERVQLSLKLKGSSGNIVVQKTSKDGQYLLLVFEDNRPRIWDLERSRYWDNFEAPTAEIVAGAMGGGMSFVTVQSDGTVATWSRNSNEPVEIRQLGLANTREVELGRTGSLALIDGAGQVYISDQQTRPIGKAALPVDGGKYQLTIDPSGDFIAAANTGNETVQIWSIRTGALIASLPVPEQPSSMKFGNESGRLYIASLTGIAQWNINSSVVEGVYGCTGTCFIQDLLVNQASQMIIGLTAQGELLSWPLQNYSTPPIVLATGTKIDRISTTSAAPLVVIGIGDGIVQFSRLGRSDDGLRLASTTRGWALIDQTGRFDGTMGRDNGVYWENESLSFPISNFLDTYFEPGLFAKWLGTTNEPYLTNPNTLEDGVLVPPTIELKLTPPVSDDPRQEIEVAVRVSSQGGGIGEPSLYHLGLRVSPDKLVDTVVSRHKGQETATYTYRVRALPGDNNFTAHIKDPEGIASPTRASSVRIDGKTMDPDMHILAVAIDDYGYSNINLNYSIADANGLVTNLESLAQPLFANVRSTTIRNQSATRAKVLDAFRNLQTAKPEDVIVIYIATHGDVIDEEFQLLLQGFRVPLAINTLSSFGLSIGEIAREIERLDARRVMFLLDTCKSGDALKQLENDFEDRRALQSFSNLLGVHMIAATAKGQLASESSVLGHGIFTYSVIQALKGGADIAPTDGLLTASELARYAEAGVPALSAQYSPFPQWPTIYSRGFDFSIARSRLP